MKAEQGHIRQADNPVANEDAAAHVTAPHDPLYGMFASGNYTGVALAGAKDRWETYAALGLIGRTHEALKGLNRFHHEEARFYSAVASWIDGDESTAGRILESIPTPHAQNLLSFIRKPQIYVLAQLPWTRRAPHDLLTASKKDRKFKVQNISFHPDDLPNEPYVDICKFYDPNKPPDFYICAMVEWHIIPPNLQQLPCPIIGQTADYDLHIQAVYPWLQVFDEMVVTDQTEWEDVSRLVSSPVSTFPKSFGVSHTLPPIPPGPRPIDVFLSGTVAHPYNPDKAVLLHQIFRMPHIKARCIEGFMLPGLYNMVLANSKVSFTYVRHPGSLPTRGLEALSMGCALVVQKGSALTLFVGEDGGVLTYDFDSGDLPAAINRILNQWPVFAQRARQGAAIIRREFALPRVASQYLRFLTFLAAKPRRQREIKSTEQLDQKRTVLCRGWLPGGIDILQKIRASNFARWHRRMDKNASPRLISDMARELVLEYATIPAGVNGPRADKQLLRQALKIYRDGLTRFPRSLVLRFNLIRVMLHFGQAQDISEAFQITEDTVTMPVSSWHIDVMEEVFPWDFHSLFFNYRKYFDLVTEHLAQGIPVAPILIQLILASLHHYLGQHLKDMAHLKQAMALDPDFPYYKMNYALRLLKEGGTENYTEAGNLLIALAENSILFNEAFSLLKQLQAKRLFVSSQFEKLQRVVNRAHQSIRLHAWNKPSELRPVDIKQIEASHPDAVVLTTKKSKGYSRADCNQEERSISRKETLISALVPTYNAERFMRGLLEDLEAQTIADQLEIVIVDSNSPQNEQAIVKEFQQRYDNIVYVRTDEWENSHAGINRCIRLAKGKYVTLACTDDRHKPDAFERMAVVLEVRPDIALVYANCYITPFENETFENCTPVGVYRWTDFDPFQLLYGCYIGPQPMWRRSLHNKYGYFDESLEQAGDWDFWLRLAEHETFLHIDEFLGLYLYSPTGRQYRDSELTLREGRTVHQRYLYRETQLKERKRRIQQDLPPASGTLVLIVKETESNKQVARCVQQLRCSLPTPADFSIRVVRAHSSIPDNDLGIKISPRTKTMVDTLNHDAVREARYIVLLSPDILVSKTSFDRLIAVADSDPSIAAVGPISNEVPVPQRIKDTMGCSENDLEAFADHLGEEYGNEWEEVPSLAGFCVLFKAEALRQVGGLQGSYSLAVSLGNLYERLRSSSYKLACARGAYVHHTGLTPKKRMEPSEVAAHAERLARGEKLFHEGRFQEAEEIFREVLRGYPNHPKVRNNLACLFWRTGRAEDALRELTKALKIAPDDRDIIWNCGQILTELGALEDALEVYKDFFQKHSDDTDVKEMVERLQTHLRENNAMTSQTAGEGSANRVVEEGCETSVG
jgi:GT2 family glycosyltransferase